MEFNSTHDERKSVVTEKSIKNLNTKTWKYMALDDIFNNYNNTYHSRIKMKPIDVNSTTYIDFGIENNDKDSEFKADDYERISKCKNIFAKVYFSNLSEEFFATLCCGYMIVVILKVNKFLEWSMNKNGKKISKKV